MYKNNYFTSSTQKRATAAATNMGKNIFCSIVGGWYKEFKVKEFCVFDHILMAYFKTIIFKKHISQKTREVHLFEVPDFVASLTMPL